MQFNSRRYQGFSISLLYTIQALPPKITHQPDALDELDAQHLFNALLKHSRRRVRQVRRVDVEFSATPGV